MENNIIFAPVLQWSGALRRALFADPDLASFILDHYQHALTPTQIHSWYSALATRTPPSHDNPQLAQHLRQLRQRVFFTLMTRDINGRASLQEVVRAMTSLADLCLAKAYQNAIQTLLPRHGQPIDPETQQPQELLMVGMGKLGGQELNVSSDIDLVFLYGNDGTTNGRQPISNQQFYTQVVREIVRLLEDYTRHGMVFRVDLRLRPEGSSGPVVWSLPALKKYFIQQGREWERYAWLKARVIAAQAFENSPYRSQIEALQSLQQPFVYRHYLDYDTLAALRRLRERIRDHWEQQARTRRGIDKTHNIKLGDGGIREIEFIVQLNQLIRGGQQPSLQQASLYDALHRLVRTNVLDADIARALKKAYEFLRRVEHMLQYREDEQTHLLGRRTSDRAALATAMGLEAQAFEQTLAKHRDFVSQTFTSAFRHAGIAPTSTTPQAMLPVTTPKLDAIDPLDDLAQALLNRRRIRNLADYRLKRVHQLIAPMQALANDTPEPRATLGRLFDLLEHIANRGAYLTLLQEYPNTLERLARLVSASPWAAHYMQQHPQLLDQLITWDELMEAVDFEALAQQQRHELDACQLPNGSPDIEQQMNWMRDLQQQVTFQVLAQDLAGKLTVEAIGDHLSALADMMLEETIARVWPLVQDKPHQSPQQAPQFAVIAYGKLGGKELGYASDLDLVFLYDHDADDPHASQRYVKLGRRMSSWLSTLTSSGRLYEVDLRLRPDGEAGLLAISMGAFENYQTRKAWTWEHQAITRARFVAGDAQLGARFEAIRNDILLRKRDPSTLRAQIATMRRRISAGHPNPSPDFDIKHDRGGMVDVEFITQYLVLCHAHHYPVLLGNLGNIALLELSAKLGLLPGPLALDVSNAYRHFRQRQHALRLQGAQRARVPQNQLLTERAAVNQCWNLVLGDGKVDESVYNDGMNHSR